LLTLIAVTLTAWAGGAPGVVDGDVSMATSIAVVETRLGCQDFFAIMT
jgi:hypothetical protein